MCNETDTIHMKAISGLKGFTFVVPSQQRGYKWTANNVEDLLNDLNDFICSSKAVYCLQPLAVVQQGVNEYCVLDGQQRLTTIFLLWKYLMDESPYKFVFERDENQDRWKFLDNIDGGADENSIDCYFISKAYEKIKLYFGDKDNVKSKFVKLLKARPDENKQVVKFIWYQVAKSQEYKVFRNLNSGKIALNNSELIKALFLNRVSGLGENYVSIAASQLEQMERIVHDDRFWYVFSNGEVRRWQDRMDLIYNIVANVSEKEYSNDPRSAFRFFSKNSTYLRKEWTAVRHTFQRLYDMYNDIYCYHYMGYLVYSEGSGNSVADLLKLYQNSKKSEFVKELKSRVKNTLKGNLDDYAYGEASIKDLRKLFLLHNIETILQRYKGLHNSDALRLQHEYERFPFELLHKQKWDIEHIASQTDTKFDSVQDRADWLKSVESDFPNAFSDEEIKRLKDNYDKDSKAESFMPLYKVILNKYEQEMGDPIPEDDKDQIGNLVLLDSHTNRSYHNSLFPRKRRFVIIADGLRSKHDEEDVTQLYIPICTRQCFTKSYSKESDVKLNAWTKKDAEAYTNDIREKLSYYFE